MSKKVKTTAPAVEVKVAGRKGRPVVENSARQARLAARAMRAAANGGVVKRGRPATKKVESPASESEAPAAA